MESSRRRLLGAACLSVVVALTTVGTAPASTADASPKNCRVKNTTQDTWFATDSGLALTNALGAAHRVTG